MIGKRDLRPWLRSAWPLFLAASLFGASCSKKTEEAAAEEVIRPVRYEVVVARGGQQTQTLAGVAQAGSKKNLSFKAAGTVKDLKVKVGDKVKKNRTIASLDSGQASLQVQEAKASVEQSKAQLRNAKSNYERVRRLYEANSASRQELDTARTNRDSAQAGLKAAQKRVQLLQSQAGDRTLKPRIDGVVAKVLVEEGENVSAGQPVLIVNAKAKAEVEVAVPERWIGAIERGASAEVRFDAIAGETFPGTVSEVGISADDQAATFPVTITLAKEDKRIRSGLAAKVTLSFGKSGEAPTLRVPPKAVGEDLQGRFVFIAVPKEKGFAQVERRKAVVGEIGNSGLEIKSGVKAGEFIVTAGLRFLKDGQRVRLQPLKAPAASNAPPIPSASAAPSGSVK